MASATLQTVLRSGTCWVNSFWPWMMFPCQMSAALRQSTICGSPSLAAYSFQFGSSSLRVNRMWPIRPMRFRPVAVKQTQPSERLPGIWLVSRLPVAIDSDLRRQSFAQECSQPGPIQVMPGHTDHRFVGGQLRQRSGVDSEAERWPIPARFRFGSRASRPTRQSAPGESHRSACGSERRVLVPGKPPLCVGLLSEAAEQTRMQSARLPLGFSEPLIGGPAYRGGLVQVVFPVLWTNRRWRDRLQVIGKRTAAGAVEQRLQVRVAPDAGCEAVAIGLPQRIDARVASFLTDLPVTVTMAIVEASLFMLSSLACLVGLSGSFFGHGALTFDSSERWETPRCETRPGPSWRFCNRSLCSWLGNLAGNIYLPTGDQKQ
jgi:hypothetical protein